MDITPYQMISNLQPGRKNDWRLKIRVTRMWRPSNQEGETVGINLIFVDELGERIHAWIQRAYIPLLENQLTEGEIYVIQNFVVRQYTASTVCRCFRNDLWIHLNNITEVLPPEGAVFIAPHVFQFTELSDIFDAARQTEYLIDVVGICQLIQPVSTFTNQYNEQRTKIHFRITDTHTSTPVVFYDELATAFHHAVVDAVEQPAIVIISSCKAQCLTVRYTYVSDEPKLTNYPATRFFINEDQEAVHNLRQKMRMA
ncbi:uncharacterized protein LOC108199334 isoform X2 [Daucus carota subsp. sativus]|uniref:uncharacterized protein LOC108199334 isoform X2 n=1 Tax=Daucus carota subsp. sativus TaxID=79200 RepID=UPI0007EFD745|nr:PREDICTED: uncharacterized protein LOC108199334 isoform X2 [Daucus carota subsp. sativus]